MSIREVIATLNQMEADGVIDRYAIGGAVGATFYLEPLATLDVDVFVAFGTEPGKRIASQNRSSTISWHTVARCKVNT